MVQLCSRVCFADGAWHKCGLPVERLDPTMVHVHVCGLPFMKLPLDRIGTCRYTWMSEEEKAKLDRKSP
jgi:hypothetical protein